MGRKEVRSERVMNERYENDEKMISDEGDE